MSDIKMCHIKLWLREQNRLYSGSHGIISCVYELSIEQQDSGIGP